MIRLSRPGDEAALQRLWQIAFGDTQAAIEDFFVRLYRPGRAVVWAEGDGVASAIYLLDAGTIAVTGDPGRPSLRLSYSYALATLPTYRGRGLGAAVTKAAIAHSIELGYDCNLICPAEAGLFDYYLRLGYRDKLSIAERNISLSDLSDFVIIPQVMSTDVSAYLRLRQDFLPVSAVVYPEAFFRYAAHRCEMSGGGLYRLEADGQTGCAAVERAGNQLFVREILPPSLAEAGTQALLTHLGAESAVFRTAADGTISSPAVRERPFVLAVPADGVSFAADGGYFPFVLD
ncbi:MAG: GNAT family N-acetyltransferase [Oscillospiraceae bacterium]|nr:GNAT family N-acetyltransferase [Oscillospiraceae bacterium]